MSSINKYTIFLTPTSEKLFLKIKDKRIRQKITECIDKLSYEPDKQGKALIGELTGYRCVRAVGQRYRVIYKVIRQKIEVHIVSTGIRKEGDRQDIYKLTKKLIKLGLLQ